MLTISRISQLKQILNLSEHLLELANIYKIKDFSDYSAIGICVFKKNSVS